MPFGLSYRRLPVVNPETYEHESREGQGGLVRNLSLMLPPAGVLSGSAETAAHQMNTIPSDTRGVPFLKVSDPIALMRGGIEL